MLWIRALACSGLATALAVPHDHVLHEERGDLGSSGWVKGERVRPNAILPVRIGLKQNEANLDRAYEFLEDVSHPTSSNYGKHWTSEEVIEAFKPSDETVETVRQWLIDSGIPSASITHSDNKGWLALHIPAHQLESLLHTTYHEFEDQRSRGVMPACDRYHVPAKVQKHVDYITPGIKLMAPSNTNIREGDILRKRRFQHHGPKHGNGRPWLGWKPYWPPTHGHGHGGQNLSNCDTEITPACVAALYEIPPAPRHAGTDDALKSDPSNSMGIFESELQYWDQLDLNLFFANFTNIPSSTHPINKEIDGGVAQTTNVSAAGGEAMLDLQLAYPIVYPQSITVWNVDDLNYQAWPNDTYSWGFNTLLDAIDGSYCTFSAYGETGDAAGIDPTYPDPAPGGYKGKLQCGLFKPTNVFSISYGGQEAIVPIAYQKRQCLEYMKLGLQGISFLFAPGDAGIGDYPGDLGFSGPTGCIGPEGNVFNPTWPNTCPYVTNVGATKVYPGYTVYDPESAVYDPAGHPYSVNFSSGGGFSNIYPIPDYQKSAVATYFRDHDPGLPYYSALAQDAPNPTLVNISALAGNTGGIYNRLGRGVPDVAANGDNIATYTGGEFSLSGGTSASTPIFAAIINRINEERLAMGKKTVGFLNPVLYAHPEILNDITNGTNKGCLEGLGFDAVKGWDPVTGLGTPNYPKMAKLFTSLP
ncbi:Aorsin, partial [Pseudocercospora fuligena]